MQKPWTSFLTKALARPLKLVGMTIVVVALAPPSNAEVPRSNYSVGEIPPPWRQEQNWTLGLDNLQVGDLDGSSRSRAMQRSRSEIRKNRSTQPDLITAPFEPDRLPFPRTRRDREEHL